MTDETKTTRQAQLAELFQRRDEWIRQLWLVFRDMSDVLEAEEFDEADLDLWERVTNHGAVQSRLRGNVDQETDHTDPKQPQKKTVKGQ